MNLALLPGVVLDGKYRIERQLGKGGMGAVFQAVHLGTTRTVAIKVIVPQLAGQEEFLLRFQREAEAAGRLRHPNVVNVTDFGSTTVEHGQLAYLVMEFLDGQNLADFLRQNPMPALDEILDIVDQVALALDAAHESGIVHRDLKPDNIWLQPNHRGGFIVKVLDFGIAKLHNPVAIGSTGVVDQPSGVVATSVLDPEAETLVISPAAGQAATASTLETMIGSLLGTPAYMAPEQCQGANVDASADIYSLSVIVYQMFCGGLPFEAKSMKEMLLKQIRELPMPPAERVPGISKRVSAVIMGGLSKAPAARPSSALGFAAQLRAASDGEMRLLADGKVIASNHGNSFFPLLLACFAPHIPIIGAAYLALQAVSATPVLPAGAMVAIFQVFLFALLFFLSQLYKAGSTLLLNDAAAAGHFQPQWRPQFFKLVHSLRPLVTTHLRNTFSFEPQSFLSGQLWPVVWASEGLSGAAALTRAARLARAEPAVVAALAARQWGILLSATLFMPTLSVFANLDVYVRILTGPVSLFAWFAIIYPMILSLLLFRFFGPAFFFLYLSARRCVGEAVEFSVPAASRERRSRRAASVRPATIAWLSLPVLLSMLVLYSASRPDRKSRDSGVPVNFSDRGGWTPLMHAIAGGNAAWARELIARRADVNAQNSNGNTALLLALWRGHSAEAEMLIVAGANVQVANEDGRTALFAAAMDGDAAMCKLLLARGADRTHRDKSGKTALEYAKEEGHSAVVALLDIR